MRADVKGEKLVDFGGLTKRTNGLILVASYEFVGGTDKLQSRSLVEDELFTTQQVAKLLGLSDAYIRQMIASGQAIPKTRIGNIYVFESAEIERLRNRRKRGGGSKKNTQ